MQEETLALFLYLIGNSYQIKKLRKDAHLAEMKLVVNDTLGRERARQADSLFFDR